MSLGSTLVGQNALELVSKLPALIPEIAVMNFATLPFAPLHDQRAAMDEVDWKATERAKTLREQLHLPFWDSAMLAATEATGLALGVLKSAAFHQTLSNRTERVLARELTLDWLSRCGDDAKRSNHLLAITSAVELSDGVIRHVPLLDFHCAYSDRATDIVVAVVRLIGQTGFVLNSGKSYHFYGDRLLTGDELRVFLGKALLFSPITDRTWIAHQLIEGRCALRVSNRVDYGGPPTVVRLI